VIMLGYGGNVPFWESSLIWIGMICLGGFLLWAAYALVVSHFRLLRPEHDGERGDSARRILDELLARGKIDTDEYRRVNDVLSSFNSDAGTAIRPISSPR